MPFTVVESPEVKRGLAVREVSEAEKDWVRRWRGSVFATEAEAEAFAASQMLFGEDWPPWARGTFAHKRVDGLRIYVAYLGSGA
jgi:hypothetical protein